MGVDFGYFLGWKQQSNKFHTHMNLFKFISKVHPFVAWSAWKIPILLFLSNSERPVSGKNLSPGSNSAHENRIDCNLFVWLTSRSPWKVSFQTRSSCSQDAHRDLPLNRLSLPEIILKWDKNITCKSINYPGWVGVEADRISNCFPGRKLMKFLTINNKNSLYPWYSAIKL